MEIKLGQKTWKGRVTIDALIRIETSLDMGMLKILSKLTDGDLRLNEMISILGPIIKGGGKEVLDRELKTAIWDAGLSETMRITGEILASSLNGGNEGNEEMAVQA